MNPPGPSGPDGRLPRLAGFADNELDCQTKKQVAEWIAADPEAAEAFRDQEQFASSNTEFWHAVAPPQPGEAAWEAVRQSVADRLMPVMPPAQSSSGWKARSLFATAATAVSFAVAWVVYEYLKPTAEDANDIPIVVRSMSVTQRNHISLEKVAGVEPIEPDEVGIEAIAGGPASYGVPADTLVIDSMQLAGPGDVELVNIQLGPNGICPQCSGPDDAPIIYVTRPQSK